MPVLWRSTVLGAGLLAVSAGVPAHAAASGGIGSNDIKQVLLISIDGMHAVDFINCAQGVDGGIRYCPNLAALAKTGVNYLDTSTSKPSDSFPGLMALVTGGSPRTVGAFYDVAYDRSLDPPATTTGNGVAGAPDLCTPGTPPTGTTHRRDLLRAGDRPVVQPAGAAAKRRPAHAGYHRHAEYRRNLFGEHQENWPNMAASRMTIRM
jgi:Type I phosphodiesterase / nucleotide pyrophosphatase